MGEIERERQKEKVKRRQRERLGGEMGEKVTEGRDRGRETTGERNRVER